jgi:hypothetical protein
MLWRFEIQKRATDKGRGNEVTGPASCVGLDDSFVLELEHITATSRSAVRILSL